MATLTLSAKLDRTDSSTSWGFRLHGGKDFGAPLTIQKVSPGSLAAKCGLQVDDTIVKIGNATTIGMLHKQAQQSIIQCGNSLDLELERGSSRGLRGSAPQQSAQAPSGYGAPQQPTSNPPSGAGGPGSTFPVAVNKQYNTPINMYSVDNVMNTLADQTATVSIGQPDPTPPWSSKPGGAPVSKPAAPPSSQVVGSWQPSVPTGPRNMRVGQRGDARNMPAAPGRVPVCAQCNTSIRGPFVSALDKTWCPAHFVCANPHCRQSLLDVGFVEEAGQLFCENDYREYFAPRCGKCNNSIIGERISTKIGDYHPQCFQCCHCGQIITGQTYHAQDGKIYCNKDWGALFQTKCYGCQFPIEPGDRWVEALSQNWHSECFNCSTCQQNLEGQSFYAKAGKPFCKRHATGRM